MNNAMVLHLSDVFADRLKREAGPSPGPGRPGLPARVRSEARARRAGRAARVVERFGRDSARALFNSNEFLYVD